MLFRYKKISGLEDALNEFVLVKKKPIFGICVGMQLFAKIGYESQETKGFGWVDATVKKINNINKTLKLPHMGWNQIEFKKDFIGGVRKSSTHSLCNAKENDRSNARRCLHRNGYCGVFSNWSEGQSFLCNK